MDSFSTVLPHRIHKQAKFHSAYKTPDVVRKSYPRRNIVLFVQTASPGSRSELELYGII